MAKTFKLVFHCWLFIFIIFSWLGLNLNYSLAAAAPAPTPAPSSTSADIQLELSQPFGELSKTMTISSGSIGVYIKAAYQFGAAAIVGLAIVMIIVAGIEWITAGGEGGKITQAKDRMVKAFTGLFIALFAVFILRTISPGTVSFNAIDTGYINPVVCCQLADGTFTFTDTDALCTAKPGTPKPGECAGLMTPPPPTPDTCNALNALAECYADPCGTTGKPTEKMTASGGKCLDATKPNCCETKPSSVTACDATNYTTACAADQYCAKKADGTGLCFAKRDSGANCQEAIVGDASGTFWGGGADQVCKSGRCEGLTSAGTNVCIPQNGTGVEGEYCTGNQQCIREYAVGGLRLFCARGGWSPTLAPGYDVCPTITDYGTCLPAADLTHPCDAWSVNGDDLACLSGNCKSSWTGTGCGGQCQ